MSNTSTQWDVFTVFLKVSWSIPLIPYNYDWNPHQAMINDTMWHLSWSTQNLTVQLQFDHMCTCSLWYFQICHWQSNSINRVWQRMWVWIISVQVFLNFITFKRGSLCSPFLSAQLVSFSNWWSPWGHRCLLCLPSALDRKEIFALGILVQLFTIITHPLIFTSFYWLLYVA